MKSKKLKRIDLGGTRDLLSLVDCLVPLKVIATWTPEQRLLAEQWAVKTYLRASDNIVRVPEQPKFLDEYVNYEQRHGYPSLKKLMNGNMRKREVIQ